jgi:hypothetical protein
VKKAPAYWMQDILWTVLATSEQTGGSLRLDWVYLAGPGGHVVLRRGVGKRQPQDGDLAELPGAPSTIQRGGMGTASGAGSLRSVAGVAKLIRSISKPAGT